jgi:hypothetical protein
MSDLEDLALYDKCIDDARNRNNKCLNGCYEAHKAGRATPEQAIKCMDACFRCASEVENAAGRFVARGV